MKVADFILKAIHDEGFEHVFAVPGGLLDPFLTEFGENSGVKAIVAAHEGGAAYMADGYSRASGKFGICFAIGGPGVLNMVCPLSAAYADGSPILVITGQVQTDWEGRGAFQDASPAGLNDIEILRPLTHYVEEVRTPNSIAHHLHVALREALGYVRGPVCLTLPKQLQSEEVTVDYHKLSPSMTKSPRFVVEGGIKYASDKMEGCSRIVILAGDGTARSQASDDLLEFAETYHIPVATTLKAKGVFPEDHPLSLGVFGYAGTRHATEAIMESEVDILLVLGSSLNQRDTMVWSPRMLPKKALIQIDTNPTGFGRNFQVDIPVTGDVRTALRSFGEIESLTKSLVEGKGDRESWVSEITALPRRYDEETRTSDAVPLHPARAITDLRKVAPRDTVLLIDSGAHRAFAGHHWDSYAPDQYISSTILAPMGWAIPAGIGAKVARPELPCVVVTGDGCMLMHGMEIQTAAHHDINVIYLILNNSALGNVYLRAGNKGAKDLTTLSTHDWVGFARSLGADGIRVEKPEDLIPAFEQAFAAKGPFVLDVRTDREFKTPITPWSAAKKEEASLGYAHE